MTAVTWLPAAFAMLAVIFYSLYSRTYESLTRHVPDTRYAATILYSGSAIMLLFTSVGAFVLFRWQIRASSHALAEVFGFHVDGSRQLLVTFIILALAMSILYAVHIRTEAKSRVYVDMGNYALIFQINVLVIAGLDIIIYPGNLTWPVLIGGLLLLASSTLALTLHRAKPPQRQGQRRRRHKGEKHAKLQAQAIRMAVYSAVACGAALYIDGEIGRHFIFSSRLSSASLSPFLLYEMLTFGLPALWSFILICLHAPLRQTIQNIVQEYRLNKRPYVLSSLLSAGQFVFSVLALSLPGPRFIVAMILGSSPLVALAFDRNAASGALKSRNVVLAVIGVIGFILLTVK